jgi:hypothetical protein
MSTATFHILVYYLPHSYLILMRHGGAGYLLVDLQAGEGPGSRVTWFLARSGVLGALHHGTY